MKSLFCIVFFLASFALAKEPLRTPGSTLSDKNWTDGGNVIYAKVIPYANGMGFGAAYEKVKTSNLGWGGSLMVLPEKEDADNPAVGLTAIGANLYLHFPVEFVDFYVSPALNLMLMEAGEEDSTTIGGSLTFGTVIRINKSFALGMELSHHHPWFDKDFYGLSRAYFTNTGITAAFSF